jgi:ribosomal protein S18 acetylase RimI-like enzyme
MHALPHPDSNLMSNAAELAFRPAVPDDAAHIAHLINVAYRGEEGRAGWTHEIHLVDGPRTDEAEVRELIATADTVILLCLRDAEIVGSVLLQRQGDAAYLGMFVVKPQLQGAGVGKRLMQAAEALAQREWGARRMTMTAITLRPELIEFYRRRGYRTTGEILPFPPEAAVRARVDGIEMAVLEKDLAAASAA